MTCSAIGGFQMLALASLKYLEEYGKFIYPRFMCEVIAGSSTQSSTSTCNFGCFCEEGCKFLLLDLHRAWYSSDSVPTVLCEVNIKHTS